MENLDKIVGYFEPGKTPTYEEFKKSWTSFWHKSEKIEQTQVMGLNDALNDKVSKEEIKDLQSGILFQNVEVETINDLPIPPNKLPNGDVPENQWGVFVKSEDYYYQYNANTKKWSKTPYSEMPKNVATSKDINSIITNSYAKSDITADKDGWVMSYETALDYSIITENNVHLDAKIMADDDGFVKNGTDWKNRPLIGLITENRIPSIYDILCDYNGNVAEYSKNWSSQDMGAENTPNKLAASFSKEMTVLEYPSHLAFPGLCATKNGVLHAFFRVARYHTGTDGHIMYSYSRDFGVSWSNPVVALAGGNQIGEYFGDWRDSKAICMSNGKVLLSSTKNYGKVIEGTPPNNIEYNSEMCETYAVEFNLKSDGTCDLENRKMHKLDIGLDATFVFTAGGLVEHNKVVYFTVYGSRPNSCFIYKSDDFGVTWEIVSKIQEGYNENSIAFIDDVMFAIVRNIDGVGQARIVKSNDFGETWIYVRDLDTRYHGMYMLGLGDTIMISGRAYDLKTNIVFMNKHGDFLFNPIAFGKNGDSSYSDICTLENYVYVIYYAQLTWQNWGIFVRKIERNKVLGLSY